MQSMGDVCFECVTQQVEVGAFGQHLAAVVDDPIVGPQRLGQRTRVERVHRQGLADSAFQRLAQTERKRRSVVASRHRRIG